MEIIKKIVQLEHKRWIIGSSLIALFLLLPIIFLFSNIFEIEQTAFVYLWKNLLLDYSFNTFYLIAITSFFALLFGILPAWYVSNYKFKFRVFFDIALFLPLAIPTYIMAFTYSDLLSYTGPLQSFLRNNYPDFSSIFNKDYLQIEILGIILGLALYPYVYTASRVSFSLIGSTYINMSKNLGLSSTKLFFKVIIPLSKPAIFSGLFLVVMEVLNEYGAVKYFGVNTYTTGIFRAWFSMGNENTAIQLACLLIFLVFTILFIEKLSYKKSRFYYSANSKIEKLSTPGANKYIYIYGLCSLPFILGFLIPFFYILNNSIINIKNIDFSRLLELSLNSIQVSTISTVLIIITALLFLYVEKISKLKFNTFISQVTSLGYVIPGAVIGLGVILLFTKVPMLNSFSLVGSFYVLIYAYVFRFLAVGKSPIKSSLEKQPDSYDDTAKTLGLGPFRILQKIHFPINRLALITAFIVTFVDLLKELPITLILRPFNFDTLATQTYEFAIEEMMVESSSYSLAIILIGSVMLVFLKYIINKQINAS